jgi:RimJ/RimL family protein N-acetyltransferase
MPDLPIVTDRLRLRLFVASDLDDFHRLFAEPAMVQYLAWEPFDLDQAQQRMNDRLARTSIAREGDILSLAIEERSTGDFVGEVIAIYKSEANRHVEIGYAVSPHVAGRGYATEAAAALLHLAFEDLAAHRVTAELDAANSASARVVEKLGMRREAHHRAAEFVKGAWVDGLTYAMLSDEFVPTRSDCSGP